MFFKPNLNEPFVAVAKPTGRSSRMQSGGIDDRLIGTFRKLVSGSKLETGKRDQDKKGNNITNDSDETEKETGIQIYNTIPICTSDEIDENKNTIKVPLGYKIYSYDQGNNNAPMFKLDESNTTIPDACIVNGKHKELNGYSQNENFIWIKENKSDSRKSSEVKSYEPSTNENTTINTIENIGIIETVDIPKETNKDVKSDIVYEPTTIVSTEKTPEIATIPKEYKDLVLTETQKKELDLVFKLKVIIEEPKSEIVYEDYLKTYSTPLLGMVEKKTQETLASGDIEVTGNLNVYLILTSEHDGTNVNDDIIDSTIASLQKAVDDVFVKLYGYNGFPNKIKVNIFEIAHSITINLTTTKTSIRNTKYKDEAHLSNLLELCHFSNPKCETSKHHFVLIYDFSATTETVLDHEVTHATVDVSSGPNYYKKIVFSMVGTQFLCDLPDISLDDEDAAFVKATCSEDISGVLQITDMDTAYLRRIWDIQTKPIEINPDEILTRPPRLNLFTNIK
jgi:hypothetical protein